MTKTKSTKRALLMSVLSMFLCVVMLAGTTFAWFTDSVTSTNNIIKSGNLNVEMYYADGKLDPASVKWENAADVAIYTADQLWEPGYTDAKHIKISNVGNLDLKYQLAIIPTGEVSILADVIDVYLYHTEGQLENATKVEDRDDLTGAKNVGTLRDVISKGIVQGNLEDGKDYTTTIVLKMQESANNDYKDKSIGDFTIQLLATQYTAESDSFDNTYDADAWVEGMKIYNASDLQAAINAGETNLVIMNDLTLTESIVIPASTARAIASTVIDLNGKTITGDVGRDADGNRVHVIVNNGNAVIKNGTVKSAGDNGGSAIYNAAGATLTIEDVTVYGAPLSNTVPPVSAWPSYGINNYGNMTVNGATVKSYHGAIATGDDGVTVINDADIDVGQGTSTGITSWALYTCDNGKMTVNGGIFKNTKQDVSVFGGGYLAEGGSEAIIVNGGTFVGGGFSTGADCEYVIKGGTFDADPSAYVADGFQVVDNGDGTYTVLPNGLSIVDGYSHLYTDGANGYYVYDAQGLTSLNNWINMWNPFGNTFNVMADINASGYTWSCKSVSHNGKETPGLIFNGNDHTISNLTIAGGGLFTLAANGTYATEPSTFKDITFDNVTVTGGYHVGVVWGQVSGDLVLNNVHVTNSNITGAYNVGGLVGSTGEFAIDASVKYVDCSVTNTTLTANGAAGGDPTGASAFIGRALGKTSLVFEGNNVADNITYVNENGLVGGGIYGYTIWATDGFAGTGVCDSFTKWNGISAVTESTNDALTNAINSGASQVVMPAGEYKMPSSITSGTVTISGTKDTVLDVTKGAYMDSANVTIEGVTIKTSTGYVMDENGNKGSDYAALYSPNTTYVNCTFVGPMRIGRDGAKFINCTFTELGNDYVWTYGNDVTFEGCTFNTAGKAILIYSDGGNEVSQVTVENCTFNATTGAMASAIANQNCAAIEIHNYGNGVNLVTKGNTYDSNFSGEWRIKTYEVNKPKVIVNGTEYTTIAIDGKTMTIDANKNVTVND